MAQWTSDVFVKNVFLSLEGFLHKSASMNVFDNLLFDYKVKSSSSAIQLKHINEFLETVNMFVDQLQEMTRKFVSDIESKVAVEVIQEAFGSDETIEEIRASPEIIPADQDSPEEDSNDSSHNKSKARKKLDTKKKSDESISNKIAKKNPVRTTRSCVNYRPVKTVISSDPEWECNFCNRLFSSTSRLAKHMSFVHQENKKCLENSVFNTDSEDYDDIELDRASNSVFCCCHCLLTYKTLPELTLHECQLDEEVDDENFDLEDSASQGVDRLIRNWDQLKNLKSLICGQCLEEYRSLRRMVHHLPRCKPGPYVCELCPADFSDKRALNYHKKKNHKDEKSFFCEECGLAFKLRASLQKHLVKRHEDSQGPFPCSQCGESFEKRILLTNHKAKVHDLEKNYLCQICGNKFCTQSSLTAHLETHTGLKPFKCPQCDQSFTRKEKMIFHVRTHTGERPYNCNLCSKSFIRKSKLDEHTRRHRGEKPFGCSQCSKKYAAAWDLRQHIKKNHEPKVETFEFDDESSNSRSEAHTQLLNPSTIQLVPSTSQVNPEILAPEITVGGTAPTIMAVETIQLSNLEGSTAQFILPDSSALQIQVPISMSQTFDMTTQQSQQILLTGLGNFDVTGTLQF